MFTWPELPKASPGPLRDKLLVAWVAHKSEQERLYRGKAESQVSILFLALIMRYASDSAAETALMRLRKPVSPKAGGWLTLTKRARGRFGNFYKPGKLAEKDLNSWQIAGEALFGPGGALEPYRCRPIFSDEGIKPFGCLVLAVVEKCGPLTVNEMKTILKSYMSGKSVERYLGYIFGWELVRRSNDKYFVVRGLSYRVDELEVELGAADRMLKVDNERDKKWIEYQTEILGKAEPKLLKAAIRKLSCFYCCATPPPTGGQVEHFPPKHWGGSDETSLLLPICKPCNTSHGNRIRGSKPEILKAQPEPITIQMEGTPDEIVEFFMLQMLSNNLTYATALNEKKIDEAKSAALSVSHIWAAIKGHGGGVRFVDTSSGEIESDKKSVPYLKLHQYLLDYQGIPALLAPLKPRKP